MRFYAFGKWIAFHLSPASGEGGAADVLSWWNRGKLRSELKKPPVGGSTRRCGWIPSTIAS